MAKTDPHRTHHYSIEQILKSAFEHELHNDLALSRKDDPRAEQARSYLIERLQEIKERWK